MPDKDIYDLAAEWQIKFGETLMMGRGVKPHHASVMKRCLDKGDPTEYHDLIAHEIAEAHRLGIDL